MTVLKTQKSPVIHQHTPAKELNKIVESVVMLITTITIKAAVMTRKMKRMSLTKKGDDNNNDDG